MELQAKGCENSSPNNDVLFIDIVLERIFDYLTYKQLQSCRLVSYKWNEIAIRKLRKRFNQGGQDSKKVKIQFWSIQDVERFQKIFSGQKSLNLLCQKFQLIPAIGCDYLNSSHRQVQNFFKEYSPAIKCLEIELSTNRFGEILEKCAPFLEKLKLKLHKNFKFNLDEKNLDKIKLKSLKHISIHGIFDKTGNVILENFFTFLISKSPNLNSIKIKNNYSKIIQILVESLKRENKIIGKIINFTVLDWTDLMSENFVEIAIKYGMKLKRVKLFVKGIQVEKLNRFLYSQAEYLEYLDLQCEEITHNRNLIFPQKMPNLKVLKLSGILLRENQILNYGEQFPNLEELNLKIVTDFPHYECTFEVNLFLANYFKVQTTPCKSLKSLSFDRILIIGSETLQKICKIFPNVISLKIDNLANEVWEDIFPALWNLEEWNISLKELTLNYKFTNRTKLRQNLDKDFGGKETNLDKNSSSILNLENLRKLSIFLILKRNIQIEVLNKFTDLTIEKVFSKMNNLKEVHIDERLQMFSPSSLSILNKKFV